MKLLLRLFISALLVMLIAHLMDGVTLNNGIETSIKVAIVLALLNFLVKPILVLLTLPITFFTLGLFLLVINTIIIMLCDHFIVEFRIDTFWTAMLFSIILSLSQSLIFQITGETK
jgi:putative membrane protein